MYTYTYTVYIYIYYTYIYRVYLYPFTMAPYPQSRSLMLSWMPASRLAADFVTDFFLFGVSENGEHFPLMATSI